GGRLVGEGRAGLPHVFADGQAGAHAVEVHDPTAVPGAEVALLVEDAVVGQEDLAVDGPDLPVRQYRGGVEHVLGQLRESHHSHDPARGSGDTVEPGARILEE